MKGVNAPEELPVDFASQAAALRRIARGILLEPSLADDAVQETWLAALRARRDDANTSRAHAGSPGWLTEAVRRIANGMRRGAARRARRERDGARNEALEPAADTAARVELLRTLLDALQALEEPYRTAVQLRPVDDLAPREIAARLDVPVETARTRVKRGIGELRRVLDARHTSRRDEFLAALGPLAGLGGGAWTIGGSSTLGGVLVATKVKLALAAVIVACGAVGLWWLGSRAGSSRGELTTSRDEGSALAADADRARTPESTPPVGRELSRAPSTSFERTASVRDAAWRVRARVLDRDEKPIANVAVHASVTSGYDGLGERLHDSTLRSGADGALEIELAQPTTAVRVAFESASADHLAASASALVLRGESPAKELVLMLSPLDARVRGTVVDESGAPIGFARVAGRAGAVTTDGGGRFELRATSQAKSEALYAVAPGFGEATVVVHTLGRTRIDDVVVTLEPGLALRGRVVDEDHRPIAGAEVDPLGGRRESARTADDGSFTLDGFAPTTDWCTVRIRAAGFAFTRVTYRDGRPPEEEVEIVLERGVDVIGRCVDESGAPVAGAAIATGETPHEFGAVVATSGDDGSFVLAHVPRATTHVNASRAGFAPVVTEVALAERRASATDLLLTLERGRSVRGMVVDETGAPIARASVYARSNGEYLNGVAASSGSDGGFELTGVPSRVGARGLELEVARRGFQRRTVTLDASGDAPVRVVLAASGGLAGRVIDRDTGQPVSSFRIRFLAPTLAAGETRISGYSSTWGNPGREFHDVDGRWSTEGDDLGVQLVTALEITAPGYAPSIVAHAVTSVDPEREPIEVRLGAGARVTGRVVDAEDRPIAGARVRRIHETDLASGERARALAEERATVTDATGAFTLEEVPLAPMYLHVESGAHAPRTDGPFDPASEGRERRIVLSPAASLHVVLRDVRGEALAGERLDVDVEEGGSLGQRRWSLVTDERGEAALGGLALGTYRIAHALPLANGATAWSLVRLEKLEEARRHDVEMRPRGDATLECSVRGASGGNAIVSITAHFVDAPDGSQRAALARDGKFTIEGVEAGRWRVFAAERGGLGAARMTHVDIDVVKGATVKVELDLDR